MRATSTTAAPAATTADTIAIGVFEDEGVAHDLPGGELQALLDAGEAKRSLKHLAVWHHDGRRFVVVGLGARDRFDAERARVAAATVHGRAKDLGAEVLCWEVPHHVSDDVAAGLVEGTLLAAYRFDRFKSASDGGEGIEELVLSAHHDVSAVVARASVIAEAVNAARDLQNAPANVLTPAALAERALALEGVHVEVEGPEQIEARGMGSFMAVARGSYEEPRLITLAYDPPEFVGPHLVLVGKAVTFDSGGISIKPGAKMADMKFDMSGGAAVIEAVGAIARLGLPVRVTGVVGATENMPSGRSMRPSDVVTAMNGTTIEIINTDCEGRMVLADCLAHAVALGAERIVDLATLTGAMANFFGKTYAGLLGDDDAWVEAVTAAGERTGELVWRLPLHDEYEELIKGATGDIVNLNEPRGAGGITAAHFLQHFTGGVPWAHIDMAGVADGTGRAYAPKGGAGWGVRLLIELATQVAEDSGSE
ncbi:MAG: leucyl aminopeptidase [Solirubrobacterales bacterium]|nr:leucyl aminopeptidase [Solirubrobacterales bacterium]